MSVALSASRPGSARSRTFDSIGIVVRRSTTLCTWPSAFRKAARSMVSFILAYTRVADRLRLLWVVPGRPPAPPPRRMNSTGSYHNTIGARPQHPLFMGRPWCSLQHPAQQLDILGERGVGARQFLDFTYGVHHGRMIAAAKFPANLRQ